MDQQISQNHIRVTQVVPKYAFAKVLEEELPCRTFPIKLSTLVARAVECDVRLAVISHQLSKERRQQGHSVINEAGDDLLRVEHRCLSPQINVASYFTQQIEIT